MLDKTSKTDAQASSAHYVNTVQLTSGEITMIIGSLINSAAQTRRNRKQGKPHATWVSEAMHLDIADKLRDALPEEARLIMKAVIREAFKKPGA